MMDLENNGEELTGKKVDHLPVEDFGEDDPELDKGEAVNIESLAQFLRAKVNDFGWTQKEFAKRSGISEQYASDLLDAYRRRKLKGEQPPKTISNRILFGMAKALEVSKREIRIAAGLVIPEEEDKILQEQLRQEVDYYVFRIPRSIMTPQDFFRLKRMIELMLGGLEWEQVQINLSKLGNQQSVESYLNRVNFSEGNETSHTEKKKRNNSPLPVE